MRKMQVDYIVNPIQLFESGFKLGEDAVLVLEERLDHKPADLAKRLTLLGFYFQNPSKNNLKKWANLCIWIIENIPENSIFSSLPLQEHLSPKLFHNLRRAWLDCIEKEHDNPTILGNAADFISKRDFKLAEIIWKRVELMEPNEVVWTRKLTNAYIRQAKTAPDFYQRKFLKLAYNSANKYLRENSHRGERFDLASVMVELSLHFEEINSAQYYANKNFQIANEMMLWHCFVFDQLGRIAIRKGEIQKAKSYLLKIGKLGFSKKFNLANELLALNETDCVIQFLNLLLTEKPKEGHQDATHAQKSQLRALKKLVKDVPVVLHVS